MTFMMKKKRFKFKVSFEVEELSSVPFVSGILFCKVRLLDGGSFIEYSTREEVTDHMVKWKAKYNFQLKMIANANTGVLESCICRVSIRKELKGGKSFQKLGFADVNLSEFAGAGKSSRRYLLEGYDSKRRQDNSTVKVNIDMDLLQGDPCFKRPSSHSPYIPLSSQTHDEELHENNKGACEDIDPSTGSVASGSSGFSSLPRPRITSLTKNKEELEREEELERGMVGHVRSASEVSQHSKASGYSSTHSVKSSGDMDSMHHYRTPSQISVKSEREKTDSTRPIRKLETSSSIERRVVPTRVNNDELIDELIDEVNLQNIDDIGETSGLQLFVSKDGTTTLGSTQGSNMSSTRVVIGNS